MSLKVSGCCSFYEVFPFSSNVFWGGGVSLCFFIWFPPCYLLWECDPTLGHDSV